MAQYKSSVFIPPASTEAQTEEEPKNDKETAQPTTSTADFVTKNTFRSQSNSPIPQATVEDLWRRALKQEADFRTRYWAMIAGVVIVSVVAILAVVAPLAAQKENYKTIAQESGNKQTDLTNQPALIARRAPPSSDYAFASYRSNSCSNKLPFFATSLGPIWACATRDWEQWDKSNGTLLTYVCPESPECTVLMSGKCFENQWLYLKMEIRENCECAQARNKLQNRLRKQKKRAVGKRQTSIASKLTDEAEWKATHCIDAPPNNWGCALSDWTPQINILGYNPRAKGFLVNYTCRSHTRGCAVVRTLECGENRRWKVIFSSSIVNDCDCKK